MIRLLIKLALTVAGNAIGLLVANAILDDMTMTASGFIWAVLIFTAVEVILTPLIQKVAMKNLHALQGGTALVSTFVALLISELFSDGLDIEGTATWLYATVIVWLITMLAAIVLPLIFLRNQVEDRR